MKSAKEPCKRDYILQKRPRILRSLLIVATPYLEIRISWYVYIVYQNMYIYTIMYTILTYDHVYIDQEWSQASRASRCGDERPLPGRWKTSPRRCHLCRMNTYVYTYGWYGDEKASLRRCRFCTMYTYIYICNIWRSKASARHCRFCTKHKDMYTYVTYGDQRPLSAIAGCARWILIFIHI